MLQLVNVTKAYPAKGGARVVLNGVDLTILEGQKWVCATLRRQGVMVLGTQRYFQHGYGGHHFVGTTNWSRSAHNMMQDDGRLGGTSNVYVAGSSIIPRAGGVAPTLTLVALAERLGASLAKAE